MSQQPGNFDEELRLGFEGFVKNTIEEIKDLPHDGMMSDCGFLDFWEKFAYQVQIEESYSFRTYEQTIEAFCQGAVEELPAELVKSFWLSSDARDRWHYENDDCEPDEEPGEPGIDEQRDGLTEDLIKKVREAAADYDLPSYYVDDSPEGDGSQMVLVYGRQTLDFDDCVDKVIQAMRKLPKSSRQSGEDSPLEDVWEEFATQVQGEESFYMSLYERLAEDACRELVETLTESNLLMLWQQSDAGIGWIDDDPLPYDEDMRADVIEELYRKVLGAAADYDLPEIDEDDEDEADDEAGDEADDASEMTSTKEDEFELEDEDYEAIGLAKKVIRLLLAHPDVTPRQIVGLGRALYAWDRLPQATPGVNSEFGVCYRSGDKNFSQMRYVSFLIEGNSFVISMGGSVYDSAVGSDTITGPKWEVELGGYSNREFEGEMDDLEAKILKYLRLGAEITVDDDSANIDMEEEEGEDSEVDADEISKEEMNEVHVEEADEASEEQTGEASEEQMDTKAFLQIVLKELEPKVQKHLLPILDRMADKVIAKQRAARAYAEGVELAAKELPREGGNLSANLKFNPKLMEAALRLGGIYVQQGEKNYGEWSAKIVEDTGEKIKPYLPSVWTMIENFPEGEKYDQESISDLFEYAGIQYEKGATTMDALSKKITDELGEEFGPYVKMVYDGITEFKRHR